MKAVEQDVKDPLFAGLAREARFIGLPINVFVTFMFIAFFVFVGIKVIFDGFLKPTLAVTAVYSFLIALTYQEDRGLSYAWFKFKRRASNSKKMFHGYSYETVGRRKSTLKLRRRKFVRKLSKIHLNLLPMVTAKQ